MNHLQLFDTNIAGSLKRAAGIASEYPGSAVAMLKIAAHEVKAKKLRGKWLAKGVSVPPLLIISTTESCNLQCTGCYAANVCRNEQPAMSKERIDTFLNEACDAGCSVALLAGGEPLMASDWIYSVAEHNELLGLVFTNGTLFNEEWYTFFSLHRNMIALFSVEGFRERTDSRRGSGVTDKIRSAMTETRNRKIPFGVSITTGAHNICEVTSEDFIDQYIALGCRLIIHSEYVPMGASEGLMALSPNEKLRLSAYCGLKSKEGKAVFIAFPGNEEQYGGCLAAGRGFLHISASGLLEPCPFAPYSDRDLTRTSFIEALKSPLLKEIRGKASSLHEGSGGCSLRGSEALFKDIIVKESESLKK